MSTYFMHPGNRYVERSTTGWSWAFVLLFGWIYFAVREVWGQAILLFMLQTPVHALLATRPRPQWTDFVIWIALELLLAAPQAFLVKGIMERRYKRQGWVELDGKPGKKRRTQQEPDLWADNQPSLQASHRA